MGDYLNKIPKEILTVENIKQDIKEMHKVGVAGVLILWFSAALICGAAVLFWNYEKTVTVLLGVMAVMFLGIGIILCVFPLIGRKITSKKLTIISDWLVDIKEKSEYVPGARYGRRRGYYEFCFAKGGKYKLYTDIYGDNNYKWSKMYAMSNQGIYNYAHIDDEFYLVFSNEKKSQILLIYNKKLFKLKEN